MTEPAVSILLPVRNEAAYIDACLESLLDQDYAGPVEIVVAEGQSDDGTPERLQAWEGITVLENPGRVQAAGLNIAAGAATGEILVRADGHTVYPPDYVRRNVEALAASEATAVGGPMAPSGDSAFGRAVAAAMRTPLAIGPGRFHHATKAGFADTVYLGAFRRADFERLGGYRAFPSQVAEDADLYYRWRRAGATVWLDPSIRSTYRPRRTLAGLWRQAYRWGKGKAEMWYVNGELPAKRPLLPAVLVIALAVGVVLAILGWWLLLVLVGGAWLAILMTAAVTGGHAGIVVAGGAMHLAYGAGMVAGLLRGRGRAQPR